MSFTLGKNVKMTVEGASHAPSIRVTLEGVPKGHRIDMFEIEEMLKLRKGKSASYTTARDEADDAHILSGLEDYVTTGEPIVAEFINKDVKRDDYDKLKHTPRPSHADYAAYIKYDGKADMSGGGAFSGRMTLPMCFAGAICKQILEEKGVLIGAHILSIGDICDDSFDPVSEEIEIVNTEILPVLEEKKANEMVQLLVETKADGDSIGGTIECKVVGIPAGIGDPIYDSLESKISYGMFGIPAVKGIEFGKGFDIAKMRGSEANDAFCINEGEVKCKTNNSGGIQGGLSNGMPIVFRVAIKPTPSIAKTQQTVDLETMTETTVTITGRHDACIVPRAVPCVEAMCALVLYDEMLNEFGAFFN